MADVIKPQERMISQPSAPDLSGAGKVYSNIADVVQSATRVVAERDKAIRQTQADALLASTASDIEKTYIHMSNDPNLTMESVQQFDMDSRMMIDEVIQAAPRGMEDRVKEGLNKYQNKFSTNLLKDAYKVGLKNDVRNVSLSANEMINQYATALGRGDWGLAEDIKNNAEGMYQSMLDAGASSREIIKFSESFDAAGYQAEAHFLLNIASAQNDRDAIMKDYVEKMPKTNVGNKALSAIWTEYSRLTKLYKEGEDLSGAIMNAMSNRGYNNKTLGKKQAEQVYNTLLNNRASWQKAGEGEESAAYQVLPRDMEYTDNNEPVPNLSRAYVKATETQAEPTLFEKAHVHSLVGSPNNSAFVDEVSNNLWGAPGPQMKESVDAISYVLDAAPYSLDLDPRTDMIYTSFKSMLSSGRTDLNEMAKESRELVNAAKGSDITPYLDLFNSTYSYSTGKGRENLNKSFMDATGNDAIKTISERALNDYYHILKEKFFLSKGNIELAQQAAKREIIKSHGSDRFSRIASTGLVSDKKEYSYLPPTKALAGMTEDQIGNQLIEQLVMFSERNPNIKLPESYKTIKTAKEQDLASVNFGMTILQEDLIGAEGEISSGDTGYYISQTIPGQGTFEGRIYLKANALTTQNNLNKPVWEVWMQDKMGRDWPVYDDNSPVNNTLLFYGQPLGEWVTQYAKSLDEDYFKEQVDNALSKEGRALYPVLNWNPATIAANYQSRKRYLNDIENIKRSRASIDKVLKPIEGQK